MGKPYSSLHSFRTCSGVRNDTHLHTDTPASNPLLLSSSSFKDTNRQHSHALRVTTNAVQAQFCAAPKNRDCAEVETLHACCAGWQACMTHAQTGSLAALCSQHRDTHQCDTWHGCTDTAAQQSKQSARQLRLSKCG